MVVFCWRRRGGRSFAGGWWCEVGAGGLVVGGWWKAGGGRLVGGGRGEAGGGRVGGEEWRAGGGWRPGWGACCQRGEWRARTYSGAADTARAYSREAVSETCVMPWTCTGSPNHTVATVCY